MFNVHVFSQKCIGIFQQITTCTSECGNSIFNGFTTVLNVDGNPPSNNKLDAMYEIK